MSAHAFLDQLENQRLLDEAIISDLRRQVDGSTRAVNAETIAKLLVDNGHLTKFQATKLVSDLGDPDPPNSSKASKRRKSKSPPPPPPEEEELGLLDDEEGGLTPLDDEGGLTPLDDGGGLTPLDGGGGLTPLGGGGLQPLQSPSGLQPLQPAGLQPLQPAGGLQPLQPAGLEPLDAGGGLAPLGGDPMGTDPMGGGMDALGGGLDPQSQDLVGDEAPKKRKGPKKLVNRENMWDSPLLLAGGAGLLLLLMAGTFLWYSLTRSTAVDKFNKAEEDYRAQSYTASIDKYEKFLKSHPKDPNASLARVRIGMARVRTAIENVSDPVKGLEACRTELPAIDAEESFGEARPELTSLLPSLAMKFALRADNANSPQAAEGSLGMIADAMVLIDNPTYIPTSIRKQATFATQIAEIQELKNKVEREIGRNKALTAAVAAIKENAKSGDTAAAYLARKDLLKKYRGLGTHPKLLEAVDAITARARSLVANSPLGISPITDEPPSDVMRVLLAGNGGRSLPGADQHLVLALIEGAVYGVDAASGRTLWRRFVGHDTQVQPLMLSADPGADALVADGVRHELVRVKSADGSVVWRLPLGEPFNTPVVSADQARVILSTRSGHVIEIDTETGEPSIAAKIPQELTVGPGRGDARRPMIYQLADHDNLYVINNDDLVCKQVYHLGHKPGSVSVPPIMAVGHLFVAVNVAPERSMLYILAGDENGQQLTQAQPPIPMEGQISTPLMIAGRGRRIGVVTDLGAVGIFDIAPQKEGEPPVSPAVKPRVATFTQPTRSYPLIDNLRMWIGDNRLVHYEIQTAKGEFVQKEIGNEGDAFVAPMQHVAKGLIHMRKPQGTPGVSMRAVNDRQIEETVWFTELGVPAAKVVVEGSKIFVISGRGQVYPLSREAVVQGFAVPESPPNPKDVNSFYSHATRLETAVTMAINESLDVLAVDAAGRQQRRRLERARGRVIADLVPMGKGALVPLDSGQVVYADAVGRSLAHPFQPKLEAGGRVIWQRPAVVSDGKFVIANDRKTLYLVGVNDRGGKHLGAIKELGIRDNIVSPLAFHGDQVWGVVRTTKGDVLTSFDPTELTAGTTVEIAGRVTFGPDSIGDDLLLTTTGGGLICMDAAGKQKWQVSITSELAGTPTRDGDSYLLGLVEGRVLRVDAATGSLKQAKMIDEPIQSAVLPFGQRVMMSGVDGTLLVTSLEDVGAARSVNTAATAESLE